MLGVLKGECCRYCMASVVDVQKMASSSKQVLSLNIVDASFKVLVVEEGKTEMVLPSQLESRHGRNVLEWKSCVQTFSRRTEVGKGDQETERSRLGHYQRGTKGAIADVEDGNSGCPFSGILVGQLYPCLLLPY